LIKLLWSESQHQCVILRLENTLPHRPEVRSERKFPLLSLRPIRPR
jgi:hypothetical protein